MYNLKEGKNQAKLCIVFSFMILSILIAGCRNSKSPEYNPDASSRLTTNSLSASSHEGEKQDSTAGEKTSATVRKTTTTKKPAGTGDSDFSSDTGDYLPDIYDGNNTVSNSTKTNAGVTTKPTSTTTSYPSQPTNSSVIEFDRETGWDPWVPLD